MYSTMVFPIGVLVEWIYVTFDSLVFPVWDHEYVSNARNRIYRRTKQ